MQTCWLVALTMLLDEARGKLALKSELDLDLRRAADEPDAADAADDDTLAVDDDDERDYNERSRLEAIMMDFAEDENSDDEDWSPNDYRYDTSTESSSSESTQSDPVLRVCRYPNNFRMRSLSTSSSSSSSLSLSSTQMFTFHDSFEDSNH